MGESESDINHPDMYKDLLFSHPLVASLPLEQRLMLEFFYSRRETWVVAALEKISTGDRVEQAQSLAELLATLKIMTEETADSFLDTTEIFDPTQVAWLRIHWKRSPALANVLCAIVRIDFQGGGEHVAAYKEFLQQVMRMGKKKFEAAEADEQLLNFHKNLLILAEDLSGPGEVENLITINLAALNRVKKLAEKHGKRHTISLLTGMLKNTTSPKLPTGIRRLIKWLE